MEYDEKIPEVVVGDPVRLHQIILNLVSNAVKFTSEGSITVGVRLLVQDAEKVILEFAVTDTGIGIEQSKLGTVFDNFQQATSGTSRLFGGTGLGLAIVKNLVEPQGGTINVKSKVGKGSTFSFILSFNKTLEKADAESNLTVELEAGFKDVKILVVEDIALNQLLMKTLLEDFGFEMEVAGNGQIAIDKMRTTHFDIVLMDLQMPVMNGFEATEYIRTQLHSTVPIIALTADVTTVDVEKCKAVGMNDYISKPIDDKLLYSKIIKYLKSSGYNKPASEPGHVEPEPQPMITCVNFDYLRRITKTDSRMAEMIYLYLQEIPQLVQTMKKAIEENEWPALKLATHSIIPTFATMGINPEFEDNAKDLQALAAILIANEANGAGSAETVAQVHVLFSKLEGVCELAARELEEKLQRLSQTLHGARAQA
jgi:CheY-like chemotaxis protein